MIDPKHTVAYADGFKAGKADRLLNSRSRYIWHTQPPEGIYNWHYALGYRDGWNKRGN